MKKVLFTVLLAAISFAAVCCCSACAERPYSLKTGVYGFEYALITNKLTDEVQKKGFDDIINDGDAFTEWGNLFSFEIYITDDVEYFCESGDRYFVRSEGLAFEVTGNDTLELHFPYWRGYDLRAYDVLIILTRKQTYGRDARCTQAKRRDTKSRL